MIRKVCFIFLALFYLLSSLGYTQEVSPAESVLIETNVSLSTLVEPKRVPLNRPLTFTIRITWEGDLDLIEIGEVEEPLLTNFDIIGTASANRISGTAVGKRAIKEIAYTLQAKTLGMAYIESVGLSYEDKRTGKSHSLLTQRVGVEVISPVPEEGEKRGWWIWILILGVAFAGFFYFLFLKRRRSRGKETEEEVEQIIEEAFLEELKETVDLKEKDRRESFTVLSKLFRRYLSKKYGISALEATTQELMKTLEEEDLEESLTRKCESLMKKADVVKFSGQEASQAELDEAYTAVETVLESHLAQAKEKLQEIEESKKRKKWKKLKK